MEEYGADAKQRHVSGCVNAGAWTTWEVSFISPTSRPDKEAIRREWEVAQVWLSVETGNCIWRRFVLSKRRSQLRRGHPTAAQQIKSDKYLGGQDKYIRFTWWTLAKDSDELRAEILHSIAFEKQGFLCIYIKRTILTLYFHKAYVPARKSRIYYYAQECSESQWQLIKQDLFMGQQIGPAPFPISWGGCFDFLSAEDSTAYRDSPQALNCEILISNRTIFYYKQYMKTTPLCRRSTFGLTDLH